MATGNGPDLITVDGSKGDADAAPPDLAILLGSSWRKVWLPSKICLSGPAWGIWKKTRVYNFHHMESVGAVGRFYILKVIS